MQSFYWWNKYSSPRLKRSFSQRSGIVRASHHVEINFQQIPKTEYKAPRPTAQLFWSQYRKWIVLCFVCGLTCVVLLFGLLSMPQFFYFGPGVIFYYVPLMTGIVMSIVLPFHWRKDFLRMQAALGQDGEKSSKGNSAEKISIRTPNKVLDSAKSESVREKKALLCGIFTFVVLLAGFAFWALLILRFSDFTDNGMAGLRSFIGNATPDDFYVLVNMTGLGLLLIPAAASTILGRLKMRNLAISSGIVAVVLSTIALFIDVLLMLADTRNNTGMGTVSFIWALIHGVYFILMIVQTKLNSSVY